MLIIGKAKNSFQWKKENLHYKNQTLEIYFLDHSSGVVPLIKLKTPQQKESRSTLLADVVLNFNQLFPHPHSFLLKLSSAGRLGSWLGRRSDLLAVICLNACWDWFQQAINRRRLERKNLKWLSNLFLLALRQRKKRIPSSGSLSWLSVSTSAPIWRLQGQRRQRVSQPPRRAHPALIFQTECEAKAPPRHTHTHKHNPPPWFRNDCNISPKKKSVGVNIRWYWSAVH